MPCDHIMSECERRFMKLEEQTIKVDRQLNDLLKDYVSDMEANRKDITEFREEMKGMRLKVENTHDSVMCMSKDMEYLAKSLVDEKTAREKDRLEVKQEKEKEREEREKERLERKADRRFIIATLISSIIGIIGLAVNIIKTILT